MIDELILAQMNGTSECPHNAGPAERAAYEAGIDVSAIDFALQLTPEQRLAEHQQVLDFLLTIRGAGLPNGPE